MEVEVPFDEVCQPEAASAASASSSAVPVAIQEEGYAAEENNNNQEEDDEIPDLRQESILTSGSSLDGSEAIFRPHKDAKSSSLMTQEQQDHHDHHEEEEDNLPDSPTASIVSSSSSFEEEDDEDDDSVDDEDDNSVASSTGKVDLKDFDDRYDRESVAFALVDKMCAPVDMVCSPKHQLDAVHDDDNDGIIRRRERNEEDDSYTFFPRKKQEPKFPLGYAACASEEAPKSIMSEAFDSWNSLLQKMGSQLTVQEFMEQPAPSFQSAASTGSQKERQVVL
ncbi:unnamed protein product [Cylindrotheca closterium]|uniref:Uncharacterized protein n=1 Tax=Cylindrotheca closterium TaxID=2856 RepID=A0AAD2PY33_9STRA|nr:unnamed protein product [Cylindrotheca closterium]